MPRTRTSDDWFEPDELEQTTETWDFPLERQRARKRVGLTSTIVLLFFAGAAFTAGAGDLASKSLQSGDNCAQQANAPALDEASCDAASADPAAPAPDASSAPAPDASAPAPSSDDVESQASSLGTAATHAKASTAAAPTAAPTGVGGDPAGAPSRNVPTLSRRPVAHQQVRPQLHRRPAAQSAPTTQGDNAEPVLKTSAPPAPLRDWQAPAKNRPAAPAPEIESGDGTPTIWLNRALPDPTPPAKRLTDGFAAHLRAAAKTNHVDWALALGVLRASGQSGSVPATNAEVNRLAVRLSQLGAARDEWQAVLALDGHTEFADQAVALAHYNRAVGLWALVHGLEAAKDSLTEKILKEPQISIYAGGRDDLAQGRVDVRVISLIAYLHESFGQVTVSCLISGHRLYARPGVISAHIFGRAVDIASLGGTTIMGHQQQGSVTEHAVRDVLLLPSELQPLQVISLIGLGGPSFPLANHYDHIHVGY